jgi:hypothetical protein
MVYGHASEARANMHPRVTDDLEAEDNNFKFNHYKTEHGIWGIINFGGYEVMRIHWSRPNAVHFER